MSKKQAASRLRRVRDRMQTALKKRSMGDRAVRDLLVQLVSVASDLEKSRSVPSGTWVDLVWATGLIGQSAADTKEDDRHHSQVMALSTVETLLEEM